MSGGRVELIPVCSFPVFVCRGPSIQNIFRVGATWAGDSSTCVVGLAKKSEMKIIKFPTNINMTPR